MSNFSDFPNIQDNKRPIMRVEEDLRTIQRNLNTLIKDIQTIKSDMAEIKLYIKARQGDKDISKGWW